MQVIPLGDQDDLADIRKEIGFLATCDHPNVVRYLVSPQLTVSSIEAWSRGRNALLPSMTSNNILLCSILQPTPSEHMTIARYADQIIYASLQTDNRIEHN